MKPKKQSLPKRFKCKNCGLDIRVRNPSGKCDHLYYPENLPKKQPKWPICSSTWYGYEPIYISFTPTLKAIWQLLNHGEVQIGRVRADKVKTVIKKINYWLEKYA